MQVFYSVKKMVVAPTYIVLMRFGTDTPRLYVSQVNPIEAISRAFNDAIRMQWSTLDNWVEEAIVNPVGVINEVVGEEYFIEDEDTPDEEED